MGFIGPNGAGKSTTIKSILNIIPFDSGKTLIDGMDNVRDEIKVKQIIGYVSEYLNLYGEVTAVQLYKFIRKFYIDWDDNLFQHLLSQSEFLLFPASFPSIRSRAKSRATCCQEA